jgi:hypothetical protein
MSHWQKVKLNLTCSLDVLKRALGNIMPQWAEHIKVDPSGKLPIHNSHTNKTQMGFDLVVPGGNNPMGGLIPGVESAPGVNFADIGMKRQGDGTWAIEADVSYLRGITNLEGQITSEVAHMRQKALAKLKGLEIVNEDRGKDTSSITIRTPVTDQHRVLQA